MRIFAQILATIFSVLFKTGESACGRVECSAAKNWNWESTKREAFVFRAVSTARVCIWGIHTHTRTCVCPVGYAKQPKSCRVVAASFDLATGNPGWRAKPSPPRNRYLLLLPRRWHPLFFLSLSSPFYIFWRWGSNNPTYMRVHTKKFNLLKCKYH